jgi:hypothetical protein
LSIAKFAMGYHGRPVGQDGRTPLTESQIVERFSPHTNARFPLTGLDAMRHPPAIPLPILRANGRMKTARYSHSIGGSPAWKTPDVASAHRNSPVSV